MPPEVKTALYQKTEALREQLPAVRWVPLENLHLTLKFLGDTPSNKISTLETALQEAVSPCQKFDLKAVGVGCFPNPKRPRVIWVGLEGGIDPLKRLVAQIENKIAPLGYPTEKRPFSPHLTIGRVKEGQKIGEALSTFNVGEIAVWANEKVHLMQSTLKSSGAEYTALFSFNLA